MWQIQVLPIGTFFQYFPSQLVESADKESENMESLLYRWRKEDVQRLSPGAS